MEETKITISDSGNFKVDLSKEIKAVHHQTIVMALYGLIFMSLALAVYFFFSQKPLAQATQSQANPYADEHVKDENEPKFFQEGSRTLETESTIDESERMNSRTDSVQSVLAKPVISKNTDQFEPPDLVEDKQDLIEPKPLTALTDNERRRQRNQVKLFCAKLGEKLGSVSVADCLQHEFIHSGTVTNEKTPIAYLDYKSRKEQPIKVLLFGGIHGDEFSAVSIVFKWLAFLDNEYSQESNQSIHWRIVPVLNPDGLLQADGKSKRMNANNVDLNRNFPTPDWQEDAHRFWQEKTGKNTRRYPGVTAASEIETQWVLSQLNDFNPDAVISIHAPFGIVDADGPVEPPQKLGPLELKLLGTYPGSMGRYIGVHKNLPMLTVELERAGSMPKQEDIEHIWLDIQDWITNKVQNRNIDEQAELQSLRREESDDNGSTVIDKKGGD